MSKLLFVFRPCSTVTHLERVRRGFCLDRLPIGVLDIVARKLSIDDWKSFRLACTKLNRATKFHPRPNGINLFNKMILITDPINSYKLLTFFPWMVNQDDFLEPFANNNRHWCRDFVHQNRNPKVMWLGESCLTPKILGQLVPYLHLFMYSNITLVIRCSSENIHKIKRLHKQFDYVFFNTKYGIPCAGVKLTPEEANILGGGTNFVFAMKFRGTRIHLVE